MRSLTLLALVSSAALLGGCTENIKYGDASEVETTTIDFGSTDLQQTAATMVDSLLTFPPIVEETAKRRPVVFVDKIKNKTTEHIDTESITDTIRTKVLRSGKFRFVDMTALKSVEEQYSFQLESGFVSPETAVKMGTQMGAEYMLYGNLSSIVKRKGDKKDVYYKFTMNLMNLKSGVLEWADEKEIRKISNKSMFGG